LAFGIPNVRYSERRFYMKNDGLSTRRGRKIVAEEGEMGADLGKTIQRLRKAYNMSLGELSEQSGVAKSIISQIERNETNPTIGTVLRLSRALDTTIDEVLKADAEPAFIEQQTRSGVPMLESQDGLCRLAIIGPLNLVNALQWYDFHAEPKGVLESDPHPPGTVEHLYLVKGEIEVSVGGEQRALKQGEALRFHGDRPHKIVNTGAVPAHATMMLVLRQAGMEGAKG
jgi:XRE family transcriptional regulator, regulator of sulfur utilization